VETAPVLGFADGGSLQATANHPALELLNTVAWRFDRDRTVDRIEEASELVRWAAFVGILDPGQREGFTAEAHQDRAGAREVVTRCRDLRDALYAVVQPLATDGRSDPAPRAHLVARLLLDLGHSEIVTVMPLRWDSRPRGLRDLPEALDIHAWDLLAHEDPTRLRQCRDDACGWLFLDRSRNGSRRWCSSADCGNRSRARRHRSRTSATTAPRTPS
jgi:predicted RNA-binding Zn ribbon-like protein